MTIQNTIQNKDLLNGKISLKNIHSILCDFDGTLTLPSLQLESEFHPKTMDVFQFARDHHKEMIIISGRPLTWGHFLLAHFPLSAIIMEGGGVILHKKNNHSIKEICLIPKEQIQYLEYVTTHLLLTFPDLSLTYDSWGRKTDRAIDLLDLQETGVKKEVEEFLTSYKVNFSTSSIHLNYWAGEMSKFKAYQHLHQLTHDQSSHTLENCLYFGDALNDQSMFEKMPYSVGVSNIKKDLPLMKHHPRFILEGDENRGPFGVYNFLSALPAL